MARNVEEPNVVVLTSNPGPSTSSSSSMMPKQRVLCSHCEKILSPISDKIRTPISENIFSPIADKMRSPIFDRIRSPKLAAKINFRQGNDEASFEAEIEVAERLLPKDNNKQIATKLLMEDSPVKKQDEDKDNKKKMQMKDDFGVFVTMAVIVFMAALVTVVKVAIQSALHAQEAAAANETKAEQNQF